MIFDFLRILESKHAHRERLASRPIAEKLHTLDALRERELAIRGRTTPSAAAGKVVVEQSLYYRAKPE